MSPVRTHRAKLEPPWRYTQRQHQQVLGVQKSHFLAVSDLRSQHASVSWITSAAQASTSVRRIAARNWAACVLANAANAWPASAVFRRSLNSWPSSAIWAAIRW